MRGDFCEEICEKVWGRIFQLKNCGKKNVVGRTKFSYRLIKHRSVRLVLKDLALDKDYQFGCGITTMSIPTFL